MLQRVRDQAIPAGAGAAEPMEQGSSPQEVGGFLKVAPDGSLPARCTSPMPEDYVMVPENLPSDHSASSAGSHRPPSSVDLNAIFR